MASEKTQSALILQSQRKAAVIDDLTIPSPSPSQVLIHTHAVALNPSDWLAWEHFARPGAGLGFDFAGEVVEIGSGSDRWKIGDRVAGMVHACHGAEYSAGAFREYLVTDAELVFALPDGMSFAEGSTLGMGVSTAAQALYQSLSLPLPGNEVQASSAPVLVFGGSTATGSLAIQLAKLSGMRVITTCSAGSMPWVKSLGPDLVVDYQRPDAIASIRAFGEDSGLTKVIDCIANDKSATSCHQCFIAPRNPTTPSPVYKYASLMPVAAPPEPPTSLPSDATVERKMNLVYTLFGRRFNLLGRTWEPSASDREFMVGLYRKVETLLQEGKLRPMPLEICKGGIEAIPQGIAAVQEGRVRGKKIVYLMQEEKAPDGVGGHSILLPSQFMN